MRIAVEHRHRHPLLQILFAIFVLTLIAFAMEGCPTLGKEKYHENQKAAVEFHNSGLVVHR
ncbi:hypothetical protein L0152_21350 [bacterium]|nr:hypothetical protein [bacterium]